jgi:hypothetical protein
MPDLRRLSFPTVDSLKRWERERAKGFLRFVLFKGVLFFGGLTYVIISVMFFVQGWGALPIRANTGGGPLFGVILFVVMGLAWGGLTWLIGELAYASHRKSPIRF